MRDRHSKNNLYSTFKENLLKTSKAIIYTTYSSYLFKDIDTFSSRLASLLSHLGINPGDRVAVQVNKSEYNLFLYLACLRSGIIYLPLNNDYTLEELEYFFSDASPKLVVCDPEKKQAISSIKGISGCLIKTLDERGQGSLIKELESIEESDHDICPVKPDDIAVILYTSGTTGKPKGAMITHHGLFSNAQDLIAVWGITERDTILHMLPLFHVHGLFFAFHTALLSGAGIILLPKFNTENFFKYLPSSTVFMGVPTYYVRLLADDKLNEKNCQHMRLFISGSAPLLPSTFIEFQSKTGHTLLERYGMTETGINASNLSQGLEKMGTVGLPLPKVSIRIVNDNDEAASHNEVGHIQVKGTNLFKGYWAKPEKTKEEFTADGYFRTGDLGVLNENGYLSIVGRSKDLVITGGLNVYPKEIELTIDSIDGVAESAVIGVPHRDFGEAVVAIIVGDLKQGEEQTIIQTVKQYHASYKCPKKVFFVDNLPKNTMGKVQKNILREQFSNAFFTVNAGLPNTIFNHGKYSGSTDKSDLPDNLGCSMKVGIESAVEEEKVPIEKNGGQRHSVSFGVK